MPKTNLKNAISNWVKTNWDLSVLYASLDDPKIEEDVKESESLIASFAKKHRELSKNTSSEEKLYIMLREFEKLCDKTSSAKPLVYVWYTKELDGSNQKAEAMMNRLSERMTKAGNLLAFFDVGLGKIRS